MRINRVEKSESLEVNDTLIIVYNQMDLSNQTEIGYKGEFTRIWFTNEDVKQYVSNSEILTVTYVFPEGGVICETLDRKMTFTLPSGWQADKNDEYLIFRVIK